MGVRRTKPRSSRTADPVEGFGGLRFRILITKALH